MSGARMEGAFLVSGGYYIQPHTIADISPAGFTLTDGRLIETGAGDDNLFTAADVAWMRDQINNLTGTGATP